MSGPATRVTRTLAVVLATRDEGEADRRVILLTRHRGKVHAQVRGARKVTSRLAGSLQPFSTVEVMLYQGPSRWTVTGAHHAQSWPSLAHEIRRFAAACLWAEEVDQLVPEEEVTPALFPLVVGGFDLLARAEKLDLAVTLLSLRLLTLMGYGPELSTCGVCGEALQKGPFAWRPDLGGAVHGACSSTGLPFGAPALRVLQLCAHGHPAQVERLRLSPEVRREVRAAALSLVEARGERRLRSAPFYARLAEEEPRA